MTSDSKFGQLNFHPFLLFFLFEERGRYVLPKESPAQVYLAQADFEMRIGGLATARKLLNKANSKVSIPCIENKQKIYLLRVGNNLRVAGFKRKPLLIEFRLYLNIEHL